MVQQRAPVLVKTLLYLISYFWICVNALDVYRGPYGPRLCSHMCLAMIGWSYCGFDVADFTCFASTSKTQTSKALILAFYMTKDEYAMLRNPTCINQSRVLYSKTRGPVCVLIKGSSAAGNSIGINESEKIKLFVSVYRNTAVNNVYHFDPLTGSVVPDRHHLFAGVMALSYLPREKKLLISTEMPERIVSSKLYETGVDTLRGKSVATAFAVDDKNSLVFLVIRRPRNVARMMFNGKDFAIIFFMKRSKLITSLAVDQSRKILFIPDTRQILCITYEGHKIRSIRFNDISFKYVLSFNTNEHILYYTSEKNVFAKSLSSVSSTLITTLTFVPLMMHFSGGRIYLSSDSDSQIAIIEGNQYLSKDIKLFNTRMEIYTFAIAF